MSSNIKETYKVVSTNFDESIVLTFDLVVDIPEAYFHSFNSFWTFSEFRLSQASNDIKQVFCELYAEQLIRGYIYESIHDDENANKHIEGAEGFFPISEVTIKNFHCEIDYSTKTKYKIAETQNDQ